MIYYFLTLAGKKNLPLFLYKRTPEVIPLSVFLEVPYLHSSGGF